MTDKWFKPKRYGYGATPINWRGWAFIGAFMAVVLLAIAALIVLQAPIWLAVPVTLALTIAIIPFTKARTDGEWRWRWH
ncbi:hypothetical protein DUT91_07325 [Phyllobacterium salinisoli]|uniref:DUF4175 domain-containing protein n=1 Tax=Phyllobacterium salinisoli TaxID=1899321 RepID=A0A368K6Q2_9HYPH|nr:hypothetical protein [Phyllobacterium salinisoli]RCS24133.1 hypothetical protein DUT91_07325 [Phyllobacterium salinisoli]